MFEKALISVSQSLVEFFYRNRAVCLNAKNETNLMRKILRSSTVLLCITSRFCASA